MQRFASTHGTALSAGDLQAEQLLSACRRQLYLNIHKRGRLMCCWFGSPTWRHVKQGGLSKSWGPPRDVSRAALHVLDRWANFGKRGRKGFRGEELGHAVPPHG
ncbi:hypothetical protein NHX12_019412 [Muraenolepis orangiensis]|uniref:Uncharacterized protein n=1 Tax=Muraenolepis orangiensis TaxID=630683 RepID=A0A9Q0EWN5_9TELE|nr:hypothetical protein NHX12_019412 [Muraenolepis orangiensis]